MKPAHRQAKNAIEDLGTPTLLLVAAVVAVVVAGSTGAAWAVVLALVIAVTFLVAVNPTMARQLDDSDRGGFRPRQTSPG